MSKHIKFHVPEECRDFVLFGLLPMEIRHRIWEAYLSTPGIHFVRLQTRQGSWSWTDNHAPRSTTAAAVGEQQQSSSDDISRIVLSDDEPRQKYDTCFVPVAPCPKADVSHYKTLQRQLAILSQTCYESRAVVKRLCDRPDTLRANDGQIVCLGRSFDVVYLEYLPPRLYQQDGNLESIPDCPGLKHIKRLAVRFSHTWVPPKEPCPCGVCKGAQDASRFGSCPAHLYQFLVRHLPSLEEFFFVDYFIVHKSRAEPASKESLLAQASRCHRARFQAGNRLYHEANPDDWVMSNKVTQITKWLRESFVRYATESALSVQRNPEGVRFAVLACEWNILPPAHRYGPTMYSNHVRPPRARVGGSRKRCRLSLFDAEADHTTSATEARTKSKTECTAESMTGSTTDSTTDSTVEWIPDAKSNGKFTFTPLFNPREPPSSETTTPRLTRGIEVASGTVYSRLERGALYLKWLLTGRQ
ncbi:hypothetical protein E4U54_001900 [Claviceps lovelessii]|nr:hypothetical protein E4U54_001900 [Claviceps lovelessii]